MKTNYKKAIKNLIKTSEADRLFYCKIENTRCYFMTDGRCVITVPELDFEDIHTYSKVSLIENPNIFKIMEDIKKNKSGVYATKTGMLLEYANYNDIKTLRVYKLDNGDLVPVNNTYVEVVKNTIYQDNTLYCVGLNTKTAINYIDVDADGNVIGGYAILPINFDVKSKLEYMLGLQ